MKDNILYPRGQAETKRLCEKIFVILNTNKAIDKSDEKWYNKIGYEECLKHIKSAQKIQICRRLL